MVPEPRIENRQLSVSPITSRDPLLRRDETERLLSEILGERVVIRFGTEVGLTFSDDIAGFAGPKVHEAFREHDPEQYPEPVQCIAMNPDYLTSRLPEMFDAIVLHEFAHLVCLGPPRSCAVTNKELAQEVASDDRRYAPEQPIWSGHDFRFIRAMVHVHYRMKQRFHAVQLHFAFNHNLYGVSSAGEYRKALGDEPKRLAHLPIREALKRPFPAAVGKLWTNDVVGPAHTNSEKEAEECLLV